MQFVSSSDGKQAEGEPIEGKLRSKKSTDRDGRCICRDDNSLVLELVVMHFEDESELVCTVGRVQSHFVEAREKYLELQGVNQVVRAFKSVEHTVLLPAPRDWIPWSALVAVSCTGRVS